MLDEVVAHHRISEEDLANLASLLVAVYKKAPSVRITGSQYRNRLAEHLRSALTQLMETDCGVPSRLAGSIVHSQLNLLERNPSLFDERIVARKIIEAHGDLRPEHICLERVPVIIDCLEFNRTLRILDVASELTFLALECERLGAPEIGEFIFNKYRQETSDRPSRRLVEFYKSYHACVRAKIAVVHLKDASALDRPRWTAKANRYLETVSGSCMAA
jgi:aminoglycoside phosphotransferase family enzyme